ncbi:MAG: rod shape-determining protein RodA [Rhodothermales bacterium]|nr:rod shape-determining protein RodA [Rhodothermales bacterium]
MRTWHRNFDIGLLLTWAGLICVGLVAIYSSTRGGAQEYLLDSVRLNFNRQLIWSVICAIGIGVALLLPVRFYLTIAYPFYGLTLLLLVVALFAGYEVNGARSWLRIGPVQFQVSEFAKIGTLLAVAQLAATRRVGISPLRTSMYMILLVLVPVVLIVLQNDTGTALVYLAIIPMLLYWSGLSLAHVLLLIAPAVSGYLIIVYPSAAYVFLAIFVVALLARRRGAVSVGIALLTNGGVIALMTYALESVLKPHHVARLLSFTNPEAIEYRYTVGFHLVQSKAAIGSGGLWGKGFMEGTQTQGAYVPEQTTDFVFSVIGEEFGFLGSLVVLLLFGFLLMRLVMIAGQIKHPFGNTFVVGVAAFYLVHIFLNIGMTTGMLPVIGIPLPFISYGGSALITESMMLAIVLNLYMRRDDFSIYGY